ncbi:translocation/assembly module TamB domain-containing protein [Roseovarius aestuariivivens]|uniref:translocation/assembly module TamB domain-containing protein n=1 Tax=Roseovarius aestuariivivens TaxID=1888910 RepID=UPI00107FEA52|nr:translocation/assembly module TamB domain-containing protein [Roseovarius aestuariivivens]
MRFLRIFATLLMLPITAAAQDQDDKSYIEGWLQDALSGAGRSVTVTGFQGALSSNATMQELTIADEDGVWFTMRGASLVWSRSALLAGRLEVEELTAERIELVRLPQSEEQVSTEDTQAWEFKLPDLPVSVNVDLVRAEQVVLGESVIGQPVTLSLEGSFRLDDGEAQARLDIRRTDRADELVFAGSFSNETRVLGLDLSFSETGGGMVSELLGIPGAPALQLTVSGEAPLSDYAARVALSTDGVQRLGGSVRIGTAADAVGKGYSFSAGLRGDVRVLVTSDLHPFFGENAELSVAGQTAADGRLRVDDLQVATGALELGGNLALAPDGWPERFSLQGRIGQGSEVRLPFGGADAALGNAEISAEFDAEDGDRWQIEVTATGFSNAQIGLDRAEISGGGLIDRDGAPAFTADLLYRLTGLSHVDPGLAAAIGPGPEGRLELAWQPGAPLDMKNLQLTSGDLSLSASAALDNLSDGFPVSGRAAIEAGDLSRFAALANRALGGAATLTVTGDGTLLGGAFDAEVEAVTNDLRVGEPRVEPVLRGRSELSVSARRDTEGTVLEALLLENAAVTARASGRLDPDDGQLDIEARLRDVSLLEPSLNGPATVDTQVAWDASDRLRLSRLVASVAEAEITASGSLVPDDPGLPAEGRVTLRAADLSRFAALAGRDLGGSVDLTLEGNGRVLERTGEATLNATTQDLRVDEERLDPMMRGRSTLLVAGRYDPDAASVLERFELHNDAIRATASGQLDQTEGRLTLDTRLTEVGLVEPKLNGPATVDTALTWDVQEEQLTLSRLEAAVAGATLTAQGRVKPNDPALPAQGRVEVTAPELARFASLAGRALSGELSASLEGEGDVRGERFDITTSVNGARLRTGIAELDRLLGGQLELDAAAAYTDERISVDFFRFLSAQVRANASGSGPGQPISINARLADVGLIAPGFNGPAQVNGTITPRDGQGRDLGVNIQATGPGGITAQVTGDILDLGQRLALSATGVAPLGLVNGFIAPRSVQGRANFDLSINGAPGLNAVSGRAVISDTRVSLPKINAALNDINGTVTLSNGQALTELGGTAGAGGTFRLRGPITLSGGIPAQLEVILTELGVVEPNLFRTRLNGVVTLRGPLTGGATIGGSIALGATELQVPSGSSAAGGAAIEIRHINEPRAVAQTRRRAGLIKEAADSGRPVVFPLDLAISAPNRIFVRGRGLDAELGGQLQLSGTTADVQASGLFELIRGRIDVLGQRLELTEGRITLRGALDPYLRFVAETEADDVVVRIILDGLASSPSVSFESDPDMPQEEALALLLFGRGIDEISAFQAAELALAVATLSGQRSGGLQGGLRSALGLSDLDVTSTEDGATQFEAGAYLTENLYSSVTADTDGNQQINLNLDLSKTLTVKGRTGTDGDTGIGIFFEKDY